MYLASNGIISPKQWEHKPSNKNKYGKTVEDYLKENNVPVPN